MKTLRSGKPQTTSVLNRMLDTPELVPMVQALPPERLGALIHSIGLEDASEIVALATTEQLVALFDDDLWISGDEVSEQFDAERFVLWLEVLFEAGEALVVERLNELPRELLCVAVSKLAYVLDLDALLDETEMSERALSRLEQALEASASEEWEEFRLMDRGVRGFDVLIAGLFALDAAHHDVLRAILERCCDLTALEVERRGGLVKALNRLEAAEEALRGDRQERRTERGFVSLADARAFMQIVLQNLTYQTYRDPITHAYFRDVFGKQRANAALRTAQPRKSASRLFDALGEGIEPVSGLGAQAILGRALELLSQKSVEVSTERLGELAYLANVLVTLSQAQPRRVRPIEASEAVLRVCAAGIGVLGVNVTSPHELALALERLLLDVAFRAGWQTVVSQANDPVVSLLRQLSQLPSQEDERP